MIDNNKLSYLLPDLVEELESAIESYEISTSEAIARAYRAGADVQLERDARWLDGHALFSPHLTITPSGDALRMAKKPELNPHFPSGPQTITLDLEENQWWHLIYTLRGEIDNYKQLRLDLVNRGKEKYKEHIDLYTDSIRNTICLLETLESQIAPLYFTRDRQAEYRKRKLDTIEFT